MTDKNTISKKAYLVIHLIGAVLSAALLPMIINCERSAELVIFILTTVMLGWYITSFYRRNKFSVFINLMTPAELFVLLLYRERNPVLAVTLTVIWLALTAIYVTLVMRSSRRKNRRGVSYHQVRWSLHGSRALFAAVMIVALISFGIFNRPAPIPTQVSTDSLGCDLTDCEASLSRLETTRFEALGREEKLDVLRDVCRVEFTRLGVDHGFSLDCDELEEEVLAQYSDANYTITINESFFDEKSSYTLVNAMCHESYHAYQRGLLSGRDPVGQYTREELKAVRETYIQELEDYCSAHEDMDRYFAQQYEQDAYAYGDRACIKYLRFYGI